MEGIAGLNKMRADRKPVGLLFRGAMVRQMLADKKHETRRLIVPTNSYIATGHKDPEKAVFVPGQREREAFDQVGWSWSSPAIGNSTGFLLVTLHDGRQFTIVPAVRIGAEVWARETTTTVRGKLEYAADFMDENEFATITKWKSAIHMSYREARIHRVLGMHTIAQKPVDLTAGQKRAEGFPLPDSDPDGPCGFEEYFARLNGEGALGAYCWAYRGMHKP